MVFRLTKSLTLSLYAGLVATLLFPKGRALELLLLPKESIESWVLFDISYFFPVYLADIFLGLLGYLYLRGKWFTNKTRSAFQFPKSLWLFFLFIVWVVISASTSVVPEVGWLSALQLTRMMTLMAIPLLLFANQKTQLKKVTLSIAAAVLLFESGWVLTQRVLGGPLGRDLEVYLPGKQFGILASENPGLLRLAGTFFEPSILGTFLLMQLALLLPLVLKNGRTSKYLKRVGLIAVGTGSLALVFTGSRILYGVWLSLAILAWWYWRHAGKKLKEKLSSKWLLAGAAGAVIITITLAPYLGRRIETLSDVFTQYGSANYRLQMMRYSSQLALANPLLGVGINLSPYYFATGFVGERLIFDPTYPHNLFFQLLAETGAVGVTLFFSFAYLGIRPLLMEMKRPAINKINKQPVIKEYSLAAGVYLLAAMFYPIFLNHPELSSYFFLYIGLSMLEQQKATDA